MKPVNLATVRASHDADEDPYHEFLREPSMSVGRYVLPADGTDPQSPHTEDEAYFVLEGRARIHVAAEEHPVEPGDVIFVGKDTEHRFVDIAERLELLVVFAPAEGTRSDD